MKVDVEACIKKSTAPRAIAKEGLWSLLLPLLLLLLLKDAGVTAQPPPPSPPSLPQAVLLQYAIDTRIDEVVYGELQDMLTSSQLPANPYPRLVEKCVVNMMHVELGMESDQQLGRRLRDMSLPSSAAKVGGGWERGGGGLECLLRVYQASHAELARVLPGGRSFWGEQRPAACGPHENTDPPGRECGGNG